jgi:glycosyltransferase involved in cell wall biosynthesis
VHNHPGYKLESPDKEMIKFANIIRSAKIAITCSSIYKYRLSKYAEVPLCGTALAADLPRDGAVFFKQFIIQLEPNDSVAVLKNKLVKALPRWKEMADLGRKLTLETSLQCHYAKRFFDVYERMNERETLTVEEAAPLAEEIPTSSNHCRWYPCSPWRNGENRGIKIPHQHNGVLYKMIEPSEQDYSLASLALEITFMKFMSKIGYAPSVGNVFMNNAGEYGYEVADATKLPKGPLHSYSNVDHIKEFLGTQPIVCSPGCLTDISTNVVNGYFVDGRRSPQDMYRWNDAKSLLRIAGVNMIQRKVLLVVDVQGWAWDYKAQAIRDNFRGAAKIDIVYQYNNYEPKYNSKLLADYDHVHFFGWNAIDSEARRLQEEGLIDISTTIASSENELQLEKCVEATKNVRIVAVSPFLTKRCKELFSKCAGVYPAFNGVETDLFVPREGSPREGPIRVLFCNKPETKGGYDCHGLWIARKVKEICDKEHPNIHVTLHIAKYNSDNKLDRKAMVRLYQDHDVFGHTGRHHLGTPNMCFEAASCGLALATTANGCMPLFFETKRNVGVMVPVPKYRPKEGSGARTVAEANKRDLATAHEIVEGLCRFTRDNVQEIGNNARLECIEKWTWSQRAQDYTSVFST